MEHRELVQLFAFDRWANRETLSSLRSLIDPPGELLDLTWHVFAATDNWLARIDGATPFESLTWGDAHTVDDVEAYASKLEPRTRAFIESISDARLAEEFDYENSSGIPYRNVVADALQHVILHGVEHRAQVMREVGQRGGAPVEVEYAWFLRDRSPNT
jgi:uncharacterized damage-inducible protein DinB